MKRGRCSNLARAIRDRLTAERFTRIVRSRLADDLRRRGAPSGLRRSFSDHSVASPQFAGATSGTALLEGRTWACWGGALMRIFWSMALALLVFAAVNVATAKTAEARVSCAHHYGCVEGKYARRPIAGMSCRN